MNVSTGFVYLKNIFSAGLKDCKKLITPDKTVQTNHIMSRDEILAQEMKMILVKKAENYIEPLQKDFKCTKDMYQYAKNRCLDGINRGYEHVVIMDAKNNKVIAEFKGEYDHCSIKEIKGLKYNSDNIVMMHGHPENFPLSTSDVSLIDSYGFNKVIAISPNGEFSLISKQKDLKPKKYKQAFYEYSMTASDDDERFRANQNKEELKSAIDNTLKEYAPKMGLRYATNYGYLINKH